jgi:hypothetical protein
MPHTQSAPPVRLEHLGRARRAVGDAVIVFELLNERRRRITSGGFGVSSRFDVNIVSLLALAAFGAAVRRAAATPGTQVRKVRSSPTAVGDTMIGTAAAKETLDSIAGHPGRDVSSAAALIAFATILHAFLPTVQRLLRVIWQAYRDLIAGLRRIALAIRRLGI